MVAVPCLLLFASVTVAAVTEIHASHILVSSEALSEEVFARVQQGEDFALLASEYSMDHETRTKGGDLGWFGRKKYDVELDKALFDLGPHKPNDIIWVQSGPDSYHIVKVHESREGPTDL